jgi:hypothetical protein
MKNKAGLKHDGKVQGLPEKPFGRPQTQAVDGRYRKKREGWGFSPLTGVVRRKNGGKGEEIRL